MKPFESREKNGLSRLPMRDVSPSLGEARRCRFCRRRVRVRRDGYDPTVCFVVRLIQAIRNRVGRDAAGFTHCAMLAEEFIQLARLPFRISNTARFRIQVSEGEV